MKIVRLFPKLVLPFCMLFVGFLAFFHLGVRSLWLDEAYSVYIAQKDFINMFHTLWYQDGNAWLYYVILHFWTLFGKNEAVVRSLSGFFAILVVPAAYLLATKLFSNKIAKIAILILSVNAFFIAYAQEARGYMFLVLLTTLSTYFLYEALTKVKTDIGSDTFSVLFWLFILIYLLLLLLYHKF